MDPGGRGQQGRGSRSRAARVSPPGDHRAIEQIWYRRTGRSHQVSRSPIAVPACTSRGSCRSFWHAAALQLAAVVGPVENRLPLPPPALEIAGLAVLADLRHVPRDRPPPSDLPRIVRGPPPHVVAAVPLKPAARILSADPALLPPHRERLRRADAEEVEPWVVS